MFLLLILSLSIIILFLLFDQNHAKLSKISLIFAKLSCQFALSWQFLEGITRGFYGGV
ncbi:hypothetical protein EJK55_0840 [Moraxella catarrhalis]|uniref:Uncharacterized protein n=1 Tax=Moraxella catarrhalis TaxID=480 RepID=A0A3Q9GBS7_MORCA|nr:hypothetical protein MCR_0193 [Moraxella catarrhalis BBH18]AZQ87270.1 hypothetical protein EJK52_0205 [Moraxella catarrhalis]EKF84454.1 hypothetical protein MCRH_0233 [Moraxella catarrhalis RH4]AZQ89990.1 hypothetical protein EJK50_0200 [Moraxella catarrhalis]AZQ91959.1 hypothetical protein EJK51_0204 [Moraxella catarrhalis]